MRDRLQICFPSTSYLPLIALEPEVTSRLHPNLRAPIVGGDGKHRPPSHSSPTTKATLSSHSETGTWAKLTSQDHRAHRLLPRYAQGVFKMMMNQQKEILFRCVPMYMHTPSEISQVVLSCLAHSLPLLNVGWSFQTGQKVLMSCIKKSDFFSLPGGYCNSKKIQNSPKNERD